MEKIPVIIDCDPGHDDMVALVLDWTVLIFRGTTL